MIGRFGAMVAVLVVGWLVPSAGATQDVTLAAWLAGCWTDERVGSRTVEMWMAPEGGLLVGASRSVRGGEARGYEFLLLGVREGRLTYSAHPSGQQPTDFPVVRLTDRELRVENPDHDFPRRIDYERVGADSLVASVYRDVGDETPAFALRYARTPCETAAAPHGDAPRWEVQHQDTTVRFIGLHALDAATVWAAGSGGHVARSTDGGRSWSIGVVPGAEALQFRDVHAFSGEEAFVLSIGNGDESRIYATRDGGASWSLSFRNEDPEAFFDCLSFWDRRRGFAFSDSHDGEFTLLRTDDGGATWSRIDPAQVPDAREGEGAFASSGTCVATRPGGLGWFGTGASGVDTRVIRTSDYGATWQEAATPMESAGGAAGIFTLAFLDDRIGAAAGGDDSRKDTVFDDVILTDDGGRTWRRGGRTGLGGAVYGIAWVPEAPKPTLVAVSPQGSAISRDGGETWARIDAVNAWAVSFASPEAGWSVGGGLIRRMR
jgi:photosystem II stability/assembly factor-like uncharacterized protein